MEQPPICIDNVPDSPSEDHQLSKIDLDKVKTNEVIQDEYKNLITDSPQISPSLTKDSFFARKVYPLELYWENLTVIQQNKTKIGFRKYQHYETTILDNLKGCCKPNTMTSILGPSGNDKTVLLNLLSGRLTNKDMIAKGIVKFNNVSCKDPQQYSNLIAYIQQDDILFAVFTPREAFKFASQLRISMSEQERDIQINSLIKDLGLNHCCDTRIGNAMIRGISGGERKRTSIGVELLTNPSIIFLDEPTTGLDSSTAYNVMDLLKRITANGRTVITTIHQPSCDIFNNFDQLILIVDGKIIYSGNSQDSLQYFANIGFPTKKFSNPADYFVQIMTPDGFLVEALKKQAQTKNVGKVNIDREQIEQEFQKRVQFFVQQYQQSKNYLSIESNNNAKEINPKLLKKENKISQFQQFYLVFKRTIQSCIKNPFETRMKVFQSVVFSGLLIIVFTGLGEGRTGVQNRNGALFFLSLNCLFAGVFGVLTIFSLERPLYLRESLNKSYSSGAYFLGKSLADLPFQIFFMTIMSLMVYFPLGLNLEKAEKFFIFYFVLNLTYFVAASYGFCLSALIADYEFAISIVPVTIVPQTILAGFMASEDQIPIYLKPFEYISICKYTFQSLAENEFSNLSNDKLFDPIYCKNYPESNCQPLTEANFDLKMWPNILILLALGVFLRFLAYLGLKIIAAPKRVLIQ